MKLALTYTYDPHYSRLTIEHGTAEFDVFHSTVMAPCALADLGDAILRLLGGAERATCAWADPPGEYRWLLFRRGNDTLLSVLRFLDTFSKQDDEKGDLLFTTICPTRRLTLQVKNALQSAMNVGPRQDDRRRTHAKLAEALLARGVALPT